MPPLSNEAQATLAAYAATRQPTRESKAATKARLLERLQAGDDPPEAAPRKVAAKPVATWWVAAAAVAAGVALAVALAATGDRRDREWVAPPNQAAAPLEKATPSPRSIERRPPVSDRVATPPVATSPVTPPPPRSADRRPVSVDRSRRREPATRPPETAAAVPDRLAAEVALVRRARSKADSGDRRRALALFVEHAREFPRGALTEERLAWIAMLRCGLGQRDRGRSAATALLKRFPRTPHARRVRDACDRLTDSTRGEE